MPNLKKPSNVSNGSEVLAQIHAISHPMVAENILRDSQEQLHQLQSHQAQQQAQMGMSANAFAASQQRHPVMQNKRLVSNAATGQEKLHKIPSGPSPLNMSDGNMSSALGHHSVISGHGGNALKPRGSNIELAKRNTELSSYQPSIHMQPKAINEHVQDSEMQQLMQQSFAIESAARQTMADNMRRA